VLWRALSFEHVDRLADGVAAIEAATARGEPVGRWIRRLSVYIHEMDLREKIWWMMSVTRMLDHTTQLESVFMLPCSFELVTRIAQVTPGSLRTLDVGQLSLHIAPHYDLSLLSALTYLSLGLMDTISGREDRPLFLPCTMPHLRTLHWQGYSLTGFFHFLADSTFGALSDVHVRNLTPLSDITRPQLRKFLEKNEVGKLSLTLALREEFEDVLPSVRATTLMPMCGPEGVIPPASIIAQLPDSVKTIELHGVDHHDGLWPILEAIKTSETCKLEAVGILTTAPGKLFMWVQDRQHHGPPDETHQRESALVGNLLRYAILLAQRGVDLLDRREYTVYDYFPYGNG
jgi:hypothetical protein